MLHFPGYLDAPNAARDPSWVQRPPRLPRLPTQVTVTHTIDLDAIADNMAEAVAAAAIVAGAIAQHFGEADARYLTPDRSSSALTNSTPR